MTHLDTTRTRAARSAAAGFTLIELLVVVAILGILSTGAIMTSGSGDDVALDQLEIRIGDALQRASTLARSQRLHHGVVFDVSRNRFGIVDESGNPAVHPITRGNYVIELDAPDMPTNLEITAVNFGDTGPAAIFDGQGVLLTGGSFTVERNSTSRTYLVDEATGSLALDV